jgi:hypothetical protein
VPTLAFDRPIIRHSVFQPAADGSAPVQIGLWADEVAEGDDPRRGVCRRHAASREDERSIDGEA